MDPEGMAGPPQGVGEHRLGVSVFVAFQYGHDMST